jgi:hypothetical protein
MIQSIQITARCMNVRVLGCLSLRCAGARLVALRATPRCLRRWHMQALRQGVLNGFCNARQNAIVAFHEVRIAVSVTCWRCCAHTLCALCYSSTWPCFMRSMKSGLRRERRWRRCTT